MGKLEELAAKYGCDKLYSHSYVPFYQELFEGRDIRKVLEIGVGHSDLMTPFVPFYVHGASLKMWAEFWPEAEIYACDIRPDTLINEGRIHSTVCDQSSVASVRSMLADYGKDFDLVIDDGSHVIDHQIITARIIVPELKEGALYVIEDVQNPDAVFLALLSMIRSFPARADNPEPMQIHRFSKRPDDSLVVIQR
jgi:demethylmacrocin O-methyltransferase